MTNSKQSLSVEELATRNGVNVRADLSSYYIDFAPTGVAEIDLVLGAVCWAAKMHHSTEGWTDGWREGEPSEMENIQKAANVAAAALRSRSPLEDNSNG
jgi:hypothetical protein